MIRTVWSSLLKVYLWTKQNSMQFFKKYINNRYFYTSLLFIFIMVYVDPENIVEQLNLSRQLNDLEGQKAFYLDEIEKNSEAIYVLEHDTVLLEKYAREKYYMKKDNEDVFVLVPED